MKLQTFSVQGLGLSPGIWTNDVDRSPKEVALERLCTGTGTPLDRAWNTGLASYVGRLWANYAPRGQLTWIIPIYRYGRKRVHHGVQYCRDCLAEDASPYFRRRWRLAFNVVCEKHRVYLRDACGHCGAPVVFHTGDFGQRLLPLECPITRCTSCGGDLRTGPDLNRTPFSELIAFQAKLNLALEVGWSASLPGGQVYSFLHFEGLRYLARLVIGTGRGERLRALLLAKRSEFDFGVVSRRRNPVFEELRHGDRVQAMELCCELLDRWPDKFVRGCQSSRVTSYFIERHNQSAPYWLYEPIRWYLLDANYSHSHEEREAAEAYLLKRGLAVNAYSVAKLLGKVRAENAPRRMQWWNPRGPNPE